MHYPVLGEDGTDDSKQPDSVLDVAEPPTYKSFGLNLFLFAFRLPTSLQAVGRSPAFVDYLQAPFAAPLGLSLRNLLLRNARRTARP